MKEYSQSQVFLREHDKLMTLDTGEGKEDFFANNIPGKFITSTTTIAGASIGDRKIYVASSDSFSVSMYVEIGQPGSGEIDSAKITGFGSIIIDTPLKYSHPVGTPVMAYDQSDISVNPRVVIRDSITIFMSRLFQGVFNKDALLARRLEIEVENHHLYLTLFLSRKIGAQRWISALRLLTSLTTAAMLLTLLLQFHLPYNRGTCAQLYSEAKCDAQRSLLDPTIRTCMWVSAQYSGKIPAACTFNSTSNVYGQVAFVYIVVIVLMAMGPVNYLLDLLFNNIVSAPALASARDTVTAIANETIRVQVHQKVKAQLKAFQSELLDYRRIFPRDPLHPDCLEFDSQWGLMRTKEGNMEIMLIDKMAADMYDVVAQMWKLRSKLETLSDAQCGTELLYLFTLDLLGRWTPAARIFAAKAERGVKNTQARVSVRFKTFTIIMILLFDAAMMYLTIYLARKQLLSWLLLDLAQFLSYVALDFICIEGSKVLWCHFVLPSHVAPEVFQAHATILDTLDTLLADTVESRSLHQSFSTSDHFYASSRIAKSFPGLFESALVLSYKNPLPAFTGFYWGRLRKPQVDGDAGASASSGSPRPDMGTMNSSFQSSLSHSPIRSSSVRPVAGTAPPSPEVLVANDRLSITVPSDSPVTANNDGEIRFVSTISALPSSLEKSLLDASPANIVRKEYRGLQSALLDSEAAQSLGQEVYRSFFWTCLRAMAVCPIEVQHLICHILQPLAIFAAINLCYVMIDHAIISIYVVVVTVVVLAIVLVLYIQHERARLAVKPMPVPCSTGRSPPGISPIKNPPAAPASRANLEDEEEDDEISRHLSRLRNEATHNHKMAALARGLGDSTASSFFDYDGHEAQDGDIESALPMLPRGSAGFIAHGPESPARARLEATFDQWTEEGRTTPQFTSAQPNIPVSSPREKYFQNYHKNATRSLPPISSHSSSPMISQKLLGPVVMTASPSTSGKIAPSLALLTGAGVAAVIDTHKPASDPSVSKVEDSRAKEESKQEIEKKEPQKEKEKEREKVKPPRRSVGGMDGEEEDEDFEYEGEEEEDEEEKELRPRRNGRSSNHRSHRQDGDDRDRGQERGRDWDRGRMSNRQRESKNNRDSDENADRNRRERRRGQRSSQLERIDDDDEEEDLDDDRRTRRGRDRRPKARQQRESSVERSPKRSDRRASSQERDNGADDRGNGRGRSSVGDSSGAVYGGPVGGYTGGRSSFSRESLGLNLALPPPGSSYGSRPPSSSYYGSGGYM